MPVTTYDRSATTQDFEMIDLLRAEELEVISTKDGKVWINLNGKCLLRIGKVKEFKSLKEV